MEGNDTTAEEDSEKSGKRALMAEGEEPTIPSGNQLDETIPSAAPANLKGKFVSRGPQGTKVWIKQPRFRGSGAVVVLDDPIRDGFQLASMGDVVLPSDGKNNIKMPWRLAGGGAVNVRKTRALRYEDGEREAEFTLKSAPLARQEGGYVVRVVTKGARKGRGKEVTEGEKAGVDGKEGAQSPCLGGAGSDSESECGSESLADDRDPEERFEGWVPVMVAEDEEGENWMSLTGSWVMMRGVRDLRK